MNITSIQKHYDKLSTVERFTAIMAAGGRGDKVEAHALIHSCPKKGWTIPTVRGLVEGMDFLASWHMMCMLELDGLYWTLLSIGDDDAKMPGDETWLTMMRGIIGRALSRQAAWVEICAEYGCGPWDLIDGLPGSPGVKMFVQALDRGDTFGLITAAAVEVDKQPYVDDYRAVIAEYRKRWE